MGDGVLAVFGEPIKDDNHALNAIKCGSEIMKKVTALREKFIAEGKPKIEIGIGINTGEVFAGNIGTEERLEYTVIGDNVNLAYRIESYNQLLKTNFLISQYTYDHVSDYVDVVKLSQVEIKGKSKPIDIYEILKIKNDK
jgi:adenylate cyclase